MNKKLIIVVLIILLSSLSTLSVLAFPGVPFDGSASATGIDVDLNLLAANVGITVVSESTSTSGATDIPVSTVGLGDGLSVELTSGILPIPIDVDLVSALTEKIYDGDITILDDSETLLEIDNITSPLATTDIISSASNSQVTGLVGWSETSGHVNGANILGGIGNSPFLSVQDIFNVANTETTPAHLLNTSGSSVLSDINVEIPYLLGTVPILAVDIITSTASASSDGTLDNAFASADVEFVNLTIGGVPIPTPTVNDVHVITVGTFPTAVDVARVTIMPVMETSTSATSSSAEATSLLIEVLAGSLVGTEINLAQSRAEANAESIPTGPTSITFQNLGQISTSDAVTLPIIVTFMAILTIMTAAVLYQQYFKFR